MAARSWLVACACVSLVACSPGLDGQAGGATVPSTTTVAPAPDWLAPGLDFLDQLGVAVGQGDVERALGFYHPDAEIIDATLGFAAFGWRQIGAALAGLPEVDGESRDMVLVNEIGALVLSPGGTGCGLDDCPEAFADLFFIDSSGVSTQVRAHSIDPRAGSPVHDLYVGSAEAYTAHDVDALAAFHSDAAFAPAPPREEYESVFESMPAISARPATLSDLAIAPSESPAIFTAGPVSGAQPSRAETAFGIYHLSVGSGLDLVAATVWDLWDGEILRTLTFFDPDGWNRLVEAGEVVPPSGWYSEVRLPDPIDTTEAEEILLEDGSVVAVYGASTASIDLVEWALQRFEMAGMPVPRVAAVHFESERTCLEGMGWARAEVSDPEIRICLEEDQLTSAEGATRAGVVTVLHELAHVWTAQHVDDAVRTQFLAVRGLGVWSDHSVPWSDRGSEHAAEILAWGLADDHYDVVRLGGPDCGQLQQGFGLLTGVAPLHDCP